MNITDFCLISLFVMIFKISFKTIKNESYASQTLIIILFSPFILCICDIHNIFKTNKENSLFSINLNPFFSTNRFFTILVIISNLC